MTTVTQDVTVLNAMVYNGSITHLKAQHYNIGCVRKVISRLRAKGLKISTICKTDLNGQKYTEWKLAEFA
jgi:hypothetical protein